MLLDAVALGVGLIGLFIGGRVFVDNAAALARAMGVSPLLIGLTVVSIGTSLPELIVSIGATVDGRGEVAVGNVIGSNIANIGLILGVSGLILPLMIHVRMLRRELPLMLLASAFALLLALDDQISRVDGVLLLAALAGFVTWSIVTARSGDETDTAEFPSSSSQAGGRIGMKVVYVVGGLLILLAAARLTVDGATNIARAFGLSELVIGITLVAVGTSLPELVTSIVAALNKQSDIAIGNVVGSNIFNALGILGGTAVVAPIPVQREVILIDGGIMLGFAVLLLPLLLNRRLEKLEAALFLVLYIGYVITLLVLR